MDQCARIIVSPEVGEALQSCQRISERLDWITPMSRAARVKMWYRRRCERREIARAMRAYGLEV